MYYYLHALFLPNEYKYEVLTVTYALTNLYVSRLKC